MVQDCYSPTPLRTQAQIMRSPQGEYRKAEEQTLRPKGAEADVTIMVDFRNQRTWILLSPVFLNSQSLAKQKREENLDP